MEPARNAELVQQLSGWIESIFETLQAIGSEFSTILEDSVESTSSIVIGDSTRRRLYEVAARYLTDVEYPDGTGLIFQRELMPESSSALEWWAREKGQATRKGFVNDPSSPLFYDYEELEWFRGGFGAEARTIAGPYIDHFGVRDYITTWAIPLTVHKKTVGVVAADLKLATLEQSLLPVLLRATNGRAALVNQTGQVIISSIAHIPVGSIVDSPPEDFEILPLAVRNMELKVLV